MQFECVSCGRHVTREGRHIARTFSNGEPAEDTALLNIHRPIVVRCNCDNPGAHVIIDTKTHGRRSNATKVG